MGRIIRIFMLIAVATPLALVAQRTQPRTPIIDAVESEGFRYSLDAIAAENRTYALRVVAYHAPGNVRIFSRSLPRYPLDLNRFDERKDVLVIFRIVQAEPGGNVTIIRKELRRSDSPKLLFPKRTKTAEIGPADGSPGAF